MGVLVYGLAILHRSAEHKFGRVYLFWSAFYFMAFAYVLSFQTLLPRLWADGLQFSSAIVFLLFLAAISIVALVVGIIASLNKQIVQSKEIIGVFALIVFLILLIASASAVSTSVGTCYERQCYDFKDQASCTDSNLQTKCQWLNNYCTHQSQNCYSFKDENSCAQNSCKWTPVTRPRCEQRSCKIKQSQSSCESSSGCKWMGTYCVEKESCSQFASQSACEGAQNLNCEWFNNFCSPIQQYCDNYRTQNSCEKSNCEWSTTGQCDAQYYSIQQTSCYDYRDVSTCGSANGCNWNEYSSYCDVLLPCQEFSNNKDTCKQHNECQWRHGISYSHWGYGRGKTPLSLWAIWIFANVIFILLILGIIGYGTWQKLPKMINLGIVFFSLDILTRYIGFIMDFWGYTSLSIIFVAGGVMLLIGGYFIEKWRRNLVSQVKTADNKPKIRSR